MVTVIFGNQALRVCVRRKYEKGERSAPSMRTGTMTASALSAIIAAPS